MKKTERCLAIILLIATIVFGRFLKGEMLYFRLLMGVSLGYVLSRGYTGFAGSVNRAYKTGSTKLMRAMMYMFFLSSVLVAGILLFNQDLKYDLWVNPINGGLIVGGLLFGFGMTFSSCCASGVLTDLATDLPRGLITLVFFCFGVFIGFPIQATSHFVNDSFLTTQTGEELGYKGVFLPDLFKWDGLNGYLGAVVLTGIFCAVVIFISYRYEKKRRNNNTYNPPVSEVVQSKPYEFEVKNYRFFSNETYEKIFVRPFSLKYAAILLTVLFTILMVATGAGWGVSTPYGLWFGKVLNIFGMDASLIAEFTHKKAEAYTTPFLQHPITVQNFGILIGAVIYMLSSSQYKKRFSANFKLSAKEVVFYIIGGFSMGFGTRLANGCNVGALYTPIANFSLSGWIFFVVIVIGGIIGNYIAKKSKM